MSDTKLIAIGGCLCVEVNLIVDGLSFYASGIWIGVGVALTLCVAWGFLLLRVLTEGVQ